MKKGKSIAEMAQELMRIQDTKKDYVVPVSKLVAEAVTDETEPSRGDVMLAFQNGERHAFNLTNWSASQLTNFVDIPKAYFDRIRVENPELLAKNINHGLRKHQNESRMIRTLDGKVRGLLSSKYRIIDAHDVLEAVFPAFQDKGLSIESSELTERRLFVKALSPKLTSEVVKGDAVQYGLVISTSDVGAGSVRVEPLVYRLVCANGMIANTAIRKFHVGKSQAEDDIRELLSDKTKELTDAAFLAQVRDVVLSSMQPEQFEKQVDRIRLAAGQPIKNFDLNEVVELTMKRVGVTGENKKNSILAALASGNQGAGLTRWGLVNSFTYAAQADDVDYEESIEMERAAGQILELPATDWRRIAEGAV